MAATTIQPAAPENAPFRRKEATSLRFLPAALASSLAAGVFLAIYYLTLGHLPRAFPGPYAAYPVGVWADRLDLAQLTGTFLNPPYPSLLNWWIGFFVFGGGLVGLGIAYALVLAWGTAVSTPGKGLGWGLMQFFVVGFTLWVAFGFHPAIQRNALPDTGFYLLGWTGWATFQLLVCWLAYGLVLGSAYRLLQYMAIARDR